MEVEQQDQLAECLINSLKRKEVKKATKALENGADPNYIGPEGFAAIHLASGLDGGAGQQLLNLMLQYGGNPNLKSSDSETALHVAVMWNRDNSVRILLAHGADPTLRNSDGLTAFDLAESTSDHEMRCLDLLRNSCLDNSSESDLSSNERTVMYVPVSRLKNGSRHQRSHKPSISPKRKSDQFPDAVDGMHVDMESQTNHLHESSSRLSHKRMTPPNFVQFPYNPMWPPQENGSFGVPNHSMVMSNGSYGPHVPPYAANDQHYSQKDSFFDISLHQRKTQDSLSSQVFTNGELYNSDSQDSINTAFTWDSDIDSSTSYFSLPKHSLRGLITELKDGEQRVIEHKGVNGEASVIIGSDFESRISLGEIPLSLIKNTNETIISEQFKKSHGRKSAEKLFLRRAKLYDMHSSKKHGRSHSNMKSSSEAPLSSPINMKMERPTFFRSPFPLISIPNRLNQNQNGMNGSETEQGRTGEPNASSQWNAKVDKTTQKFLDLSESEEAIPPVTLPNDLGAKTFNTPASKGKSLSVKGQGLFRQAQVVPNGLHPASSVSNHGSADINTRTPTTDETLSQPGNEETENEFSLMHGIGSPRALYTDMNETPSTTPMTRTLFDQTFLNQNTRTGNIADGDIFKFGSDATKKFARNETNEKGFKNISKIQRKIDVLNQNESDVFATETESAAGESDGNSSGYSGDLSQTSSPDDVTSVPSLPKFDLKNSPSVTIRNKRRKGLAEENGSKTLEKQASTESTDAVEAEEAERTKAALPASPRKRLNGVTSSSDETGLPKSPIASKKNLVQSSPGNRIRQRIDHTFEENSTVKSPLLPDDLRAYHKAQLEKPTNGRRQWERKHVNGCTCELCMTKMGQTAVMASLPYCEHGQCHEDEEGAFADVTVEFDWKDVSLMDSTNTEHSIVVSDEIKGLNAEDLKQRLIKAGEKPGPITENTKNIYMKQLARVEAGDSQKDQKSNSSFMEYVPEMRQQLKGITKDDYHSLEDVVIKDFENPQKHKWREGIQKTSFNYLLLDPRVLSPLCDKSRTLSDLEKFSCFIRSIFYVGKGKESRPHEHLHDAVKMKKSNEQPAKASEKLKMILNIWQSGYGVVSLHLFHNVIPVEAYTREACMIEALGLTRLTNLKKGDYYGQASSWKVKKKRQLGIHFLKKALQILMVEGMKQIKEQDI